MNSPSPIDDPSRLLHSGQIVAPKRLGDAPRRGRLTANFFVIHQG